MKTIAITGGIGVGKSHVTHMFNVLFNVPIYNSDEKVKKEIVYYPWVKKRIIDTFGTNSYEGGKYNILKFRNLLFNDREALVKMNRIILPEMLLDMKQWAEQQPSKGFKSPYVIVECAVIVENDLYSNFDKTILVTAPINVRVERLMKNRSMTLGDINNRMKNQESEATKRLMCDYFIHNDGGALSSKIELVHNSILTICGREDLIYGFSN